MKKKGCPNVTHAQYHHLEDDKEQQKQGDEEAAEEEKKEKICSHRFIMMPFATITRPSLSTRPSMPRTHGPPRLVFRIA